MKKVLVTLPLETKHKEQLLAAGAGCEMNFRDLAEVTGEDITSADILIGNVPAGMPPNQDQIDLTESMNDLFLAKPLHAHAKPRLHASMYGN